MSEQSTPVDISGVMTLADITRLHADERPDAVALSFEGRQTRFVEFHRRTNQVARALQAAGVSDGSRIAYLGKNSDRYFEALFGAAKIGAVMVPVGWRLAPAEAAAILKDAEALVVFVTPDALEQAGAAAAETDVRRIFIAIDGAEIDGAEAYEQWISRHLAEDLDVRMTGDAVLLQMYTSGTTGNPKGVMLTHGNILGKQRDAARAHMDWHVWTPSDVGLVAMPVGHVGGSLWGIVGLLYGAMGLVAREFDPHRVLDYIEQDGASKIFMVPAALQIVVRQPRSRQVDYGRLRHILYGASPMPADLLRECLEVFGCGFCQQYGMTETAGAIVYLPPDDHDPHHPERMRAAGIPMPGVELKIVDHAGQAVSPGVIGEVLTRSASNMAGYWHMPDATAAAMDADGWLRTGDAGYVDAEGYLFIHDRVKDMIISGAENIYPAEVENAIYGHPDVAEVAVIGVPDEKWGEAVKALIVPKAGASCDADAVLAFARTRIAAFKLPKSVDFVEALPRNAAGKVLRRELRAPFWAGRERNVN